MPNPAFVKRNFYWPGTHKCIGMEGVFWDALEEIAAERGMKLTLLVGEILSGSDNAVPSRLRIYVLNHFRFGRARCSESDSAGEIVGGIAGEQVK